MSAVAFGKYQLERRLAFGGMAEIYLAFLSGESGFRKPVVIKRILPQFSSNPDFVQMFVDEARIAATLSHPNVVQVFDFGRGDNTHYIAMEYVDGVDLRTLLRHVRQLERPLTVPQVCVIGAAVAEGLSYVHAAVGNDGTPLDIVHRDISPHNIMIARAGGIKVMDFGIAKAAARSVRTKTGALKGKIAYMAPEQAAGDPVDHRCDQFALGLVLWECLAGRRMFDGASEAEILRRVLDCEILPLPEHCADLPEAVGQIIFRMLEASPSDRYPDLRDAAKAMESFRFSLGGKGVVSLEALLEELEIPAVGDKPGTLPLPQEGRGGGTIPLDTDDWAGKEETSGTQTYDPQEKHAGTPTQQVASPQVNPRKSSVWAPLWGAIVMGVVVVALVSYGQRGDGPRVERAALADGTAFRPLTSLIDVSSEPPGARILVGGADTGLRTPAQVPRQRRHVSVAIGVNLRGHRPWEEHITPVNPYETVRAMLVARPAQKPAASNKSASLRSIKPRRFGSVSVRSTGPWYQVHWGSQYLGNTPLSAARMPVGDHVLDLHNPQTGERRQLSVKIQRSKDTKMTTSKWRDSE